MSLRDFVRSWLRGLRATSRAVADEVTAYRADRAALLAYREGRRWLQLEALMCLPTVEPDYSNHTYPYGTADLVDGGKWLADVWPDSWGHYDDNTRELTAGIWLGKRADLQHGELVS